MCCLRQTSVVLMTAHKTFLKLINKLIWLKKKPTWHHLVTLNKQTIAFFFTKDLSTQYNYWAWQLLRTEGSVTLNSVLNNFYHVNLPNEVLLEHLSGICRMTHILKALRGIPTCLLQQNLFTSWMLNSQNRLEHFMISEFTGCSLHFNVWQLIVYQLVIIY